MPNTKKKVTNQLKKTNASSKLGAGRRKDKDPGSQRSAEVIQRLKMYSNGKAIRNKAGMVVAGAFQMKDRAGDSKITDATGRIQPDRRWFGNTRVVDPKDLDRFRQEMTEKVSDPYSVVLKRKKLPMGLLQEAAEFAAGANASQKQALLEQEPFEQTFGQQSRRKRVKLDQLLMARSAVAVEKKASAVAPPGQAQTMNTSCLSQSDAAGYAALLQTAQKSQETYQDINTREGIVPWGRDSNLLPEEGVDWRHARKDDLFLKGQSKRIWGEFFKVVDCSDVILHVIDARNVPGTRCTMIERHIAKNASHKHLIFILNKIDLVPNWVAKRWMGELAKDRPTIAFHASMTHAFGKGALISLLRQFGQLHQDKKQISVGVIGYPNVGKSSVINTLISKKSCKVAPIPGETKIWQYITLFKRIALIDCPGVVVDTAGDTETDSVLKGVVRAERLESPEDFIEPILEKVKREHINGQYKISKEEDVWSNSTELMELIAKKCGRLLKGGDPCLRSAAIMLINDFQRGRLPHYVPPPELKTDEDVTTERAVVVADGKIEIEAQNLDEIGEEHMTSKAVSNSEDDDALETAKQTAVSAGTSEVEDRNTSEAETTAEEGVEEDGGAKSLIAAGEWDE